MTQSGIYKIENIETKKFYIGSSCHLSSRKTGHLCNLRANKHPNPILQANYNKYGEAKLCFSIVEECSKEILIEREQYYIDALGPEFNCNLEAGKPPVFERTLEYRQKMSKAKLGSHPKQPVMTPEFLAYKQKSALKMRRQYTESNNVSSPAHILIEKDVVEIRELLLENVLYLSDIAELYKVTYGCISDIKYNRSWNHLGPTPKINSKTKLRGLTKDERISRSKIYATFNSRKEVI